MSGPAIHPISLWLGDNAPSLAWRFPFDVAGSDFVLVLRFGGRVFTRSVAGGELAMDTGARTVSWAYAPEDFAPLARRDGVYELTRVMTGGEVRTYVGGPVTIRSLING